MRGKNTEELTYRGPDLKERDATRKEAGCKDGYCAGLIAAGIIPANFNSCDEVSPLDYSQLSETQLGFIRSPTI